MYRCPCDRLTNCWSDPSIERRPALSFDQLIPGSTLLGYVNADHWTIAIPVEEKYSNRDRAITDRNRKLRGLLFEAMILFLAESLGAAQ
jgi:hypothetical protein